MSSNHPENPGSQACENQQKPAPKQRPKQTIIVFTDLDGTLLDIGTHSFEQARPALMRLKTLSAPLIICSSKTRQEIESYRSRLGIFDPFVAENGGGIFIPRGYFPEGITDSEILMEERGNYEVVVLGTAYPALRRAVEQLRRAGFPVKGFGDMTLEEIVRITGLTVEEAAMAKERDFDEPFILETETDVGALEARIRLLGFRLTRGALYHIHGKSDKGASVAILSDLFRRTYGSIITIGLGDNLNDASMLAEVDYPVLVQKPDGSCDPDVFMPNLLRADGVGPSGWNTAVLGLLDQLVARVNSPENANI